MSNILNNAQETYNRNNTLVILEIANLSIPQELPASATTGNRLKQYQVSDLACSRLSSMVTMSRLIFGMKCPLLRALFRNPSISDVRSVTEYGF